MLVGICVADVLRSTCDVPKTGRTSSRRRWADRPSCPKVRQVGHPLANWARCAASWASWYFAKECMDLFFGRSLCSVIHVVVINLLFDVIYYTNVFAKLVVIKL